MTDRKTVTITSPLWLEGLGIVRFGETHRALGEEQTGANETRKKGRLVIWKYRAKSSRCDLQVFFFLLLFVTSVL